MMKVGDRVVYVDPERKEHNALVICAFHQTEEDPHPSLNLVIVDPDPKKEDSYGRQIDRVTSIVHASKQSAGANCWK